jgi:hypothetical protein
MNDFSKIELKRASRLAEFAYHAPQAIGENHVFDRMLDESCTGFPINVAGDDPTDPQITVWRFKDSNDIYIAFRGQHDPDQMFATLWNPRRGPNYSPKAVHEGLLRDLIQIEPYVRWWLEHSIQQRDRIIVTGHGLGGSLATIAAPLFADRYPDHKVCCYTFGATRIGTPDFKKWFNQRVAEHVRVIDSSDPIPYLPIDRTEFGHPNDALCITRGGYVETWSADVEPSVQVLDGINRIDLDEWRWQQSAVKYRKRIDAAVSRTALGRTFKEYIVRPTKLSRRGA